MNCIIIMYHLIFLSRPEELFKHRQGLEKTIPEKGGPKDYIPDGTWIQNKHIEKFHEERQRVLAEPRVQKK